MFSKPNNQQWNDWDFTLRTSVNRVKGIANVTKYGLNDNISNSREDIWSTGGILSFLSSPETLSVVSDDNNDKSGDTGARTISIYGICTNYQSIAESVTLNGTTPVITKQPFLRVNRVRVTTAGSSGTNEGKITLTATTAATVQAEVPAGVGSTLKSQYTLPDGFYGYIKGSILSTLNNDQVNVRIEVRPFGGAWVALDNINFVSTTIVQNYQSPLVITPKSDIRATGIRLAGTGTASISARYNFVAVSEDLVNTKSIIEGSI